VSTFVSPGAIALAAVHPLDGRAATSAGATVVVGTSAVGAVGAVERVELGGFADLPELLEHDATNDAVTTATASTPRVDRMRIAPYSRE
jgi:hypothetical protein